MRLKQSATEIVAYCALAVVMAIVIYLLASFEYERDLLFFGQWHRSLGFNELFEFKWDWVWNARLFVAGVVFTSLTVSFIYLRLGLTDVNKEDWSLVVAALGGMLAVIIAWTFAVWVVDESLLSSWNLANYAVDFGKTDPIFNKDIGFYVFGLPKLQLIELLIDTALVFAVIGGLYFVLMNLFDYEDDTTRPVSFVLLLFAMWCGLQVWDNTNIDVFNVMFSDLGRVFGVGATEYVWTIWLIKTSVWIYLILSVTAALTGLWAFFSDRVEIPTAAHAIVLVLWIGVMAGIPSCYQNFVVERYGELNYETGNAEIGPCFLCYNIEATRDAYQLEEEGLSEVEFPYTADIPDKEALSLLTGDENLDFVRAWRPDTALPYIRRNQERLPQDEFSAIEADRYYDKNGVPHPVMIGAREMDINQISEQKRTWQNIHELLIAGSGIVVLEGGSTFAQKGKDPKMLLGNQPMEYFTGDLEIPHVITPEIYFGIREVPFAVVETSSNKDRYHGTGGIRIGDNRRMFAWAMDAIEGDVNFFGYFAALNRSRTIDGDSRLLVFRDVQSRMNQLMPFIHWESYPYYIVRENGSLAVVLNGFTQSAYYPYSQRYNGVNYMRHSVTAVMDTYNGSVDVYVVDKSDPIIRTWVKVLPNTFKMELPADLKKHIRYPDELTLWRLAAYSQYHNVDPQTFFFGEKDLTLSLERVGEQNSGGKPGETAIDPYYQTVILPGQQERTYQAVFSMTPLNKNILALWGAVSSEYKDYGKMTIYRLPQNVQANGLMDFEELIDTSLSATIGDLTRSNSIIRGAATLVPIGEKSLLYVEPFMTVSSRSANPNLPPMPQFEGWVVANHERAVLDTTLRGAIRKLYTGGESTPVVANEDVSERPVESAPTVDLSNLTVGGTPEEIALNIQQLLDAARAEPDMVKKQQYYDQAAALIVKQLELLQMENVTESVDE